MKKNGLMAGGLDEWKNGRLEEWKIEGLDEWMKKRRQRTEDRKLYSDDCRLYSEVRRQEIIDDRSFHVQPFLRIYAYTHLRIYAFTHIRICTFTHNQNLEEQS